MAAFKKTNVKLLSKPSQKLTPDVEYWKKLSVPVLMKEFGAIDYVDFSPCDPNYFAVTCSARIQIYSAVTKLPVKNLNKFRDTAYGGSFRSDGRLLCAGSEESLVRLFDMETKSLLRIFRGHTSPVHRCFFTSDKTHIASFSDDKTVAIWDVPSETKLSTFTGHDDYVRAGAVSYVSPTTFISGCYDKCVRMFDSRTSTEPVFTVDHGSPVESVLFFPSGGIFASAGGTEVRVWDAIAGGRLLAKLMHHHKTVTCLHLASDNKRLMSGSLDRHVKVYDVSTYQAVHTIDYTSSILALGVSKTDSTVVIGTVDGMVSIRCREEKESKPAVKKTRNRLSYRNAADLLPIENIVHQDISETVLASGDVVVHNVTKTKESKYDMCLRKYQYAQALDCVMLPYIVNKTPHVTVSLMQELSRRKGLKVALSGREGKSLLVILRFLIKYIGDYRFTRILIDVANVLLDVYGNHLTDCGPEALKLFETLAKRLREEEELTKQLLCLQGALQMILAGASITEVASPMDEVANTTIQPSDAAMQNFVVNVT